MSNRPRSNRRIWIHRPVVDSDYTDHWEYKLIPDSYLRNYCKSGNTIRQNWRPVAGAQPTPGGLQIDSDQVEVKKTVAKVTIKVVK